MILPMTNSTPTQLRFASSADFTVRADFNGGGSSSGLGSLLLRAIDQQIGLSQRLASALADRRHPGYVKHSLHEVLTQRIYQVASGYEDGNDSNALRHDPMFRLSVERKPFDHSEDAVYGQQPLAFYNHHYRSTCYAMQKQIIEGAEVQRSSGNVFADLGLPDAEKLKIKTGLVIEIRKAMRTLGLNQKEAAKRMGIPQPKVSGMMRGDFTNLSERKLMDCLNRLGYDIEIKVQPASAPVGHLTLAVA